MKTKTVLITGTSSGLGKLLVEFFASEGWNVIATSRNKQDIFGDLKNVINAKLDITDWDDLQDFANKNKDLWSSIDVVINNAGMAIVGALEDTDIDQIQQIFKVNVIGVVNTLKSVLPIFKKKKQGRIINISSAIGLSVDIPLASVYSMSKFALEGLSEGLYFELKAQNIDLHLVEPGGFKSSLLENAIVNIPTENPENIRIFENLNRFMELKSKDKNTLHTEIADVADTVFKLANGDITKFRNIIGGDSNEIINIRNKNTIDQYLSIINKQFE